MTAPTPSWVIRPAHPDDAASVIALITSVIAEPVNNLLSEPGEFTMTEEQERLFLTEQTMRPDWAAFVAATSESPARVIGLITADGQRRRAIRHRANIGISVAREWRGQGVGRALMQRAIAWAHESGVITRLELEVLTRNEAAIHLYERLGFQREGIRRNGLLRHGAYLDELMMGLLL
ncbi:MAG TPA: GNAT family protein [Ktedonobacterales bacterium]|nr:GNAT family protein [Ktedonobacterales bacterium]